MILKEEYKLKLKSIGPLSYHLHSGYTRDEDGTLVADPRKYVDKILESYEKMLEITQKLTYLSSVIKTKSNSTKQLLDS